MKDDRYKVVKFLIDKGYIKTLREISRAIPSSVVAKDMGIGYLRWIRKIRHVERFSFQELYRLAALLGVDGSVLIRLAHEQYKADEQRKEKERGKATG